MMASVPVIPSLSLSLPNNMKHNRNMITDNTMNVKNEYAAPEVELVEIVTEQSTLQVLSDYENNDILFE